MNKLQLDSIIERFNLAPSTTFLGCTVYLPETDEFLAQHEITATGKVWKWTPLPFKAQKFTDFKAARTVANRYKKAPAEVVYLFDTPNQIMAMGHKVVMGAN